MLPAGVQDSQCGFKLFEADAAREIFARLTVERFAFDVEALVIAAALGYRVIEVPVSWHEDHLSKVRLFRDAHHMARDVFRIRRQLRAGTYTAPAGTLPAHDPSASR
jgi:dolichyl-phosphate beta-glucosyltransferase